ncbi:MAG TPA: hypothetical protein VHT27_00645 [Solirubrobacteraceae bacterium]|jgi:hypothetical protein|nr:hypothetical protein [Solirubrobacteraceae bacterium]
MNNSIRPRRRWALAGAPAVLACAVTLSSASGAVAALRPTANTGNAVAVSYSSATLRGSVNPEGSDTSYYFQYGLTRAYGGQSAIADAGAGTHSVPISLPVSGLQPVSVYHYRLVAVNSAGASIGSDHTLLTTKVPLSLAILASPNPLPFGGTATIQGTLSGTGNAGREVTLQADPFPYATGFQPLGNPEVTNATGGFQFVVSGLAQVTQFRVVTSTKPQVVSPVALENVAVLVASHIRHAHRRGYARFYGTVTPAEPGMQVGILRIEHGHGVLVGGTALQPLSATSSHFSSRAVRVRRGVYRVLVRVTTGAQVSAYGQPLVIR